MRDDTRCGTFGKIHHVALVHRASPSCVDARLRRAPVWIAERNALNRDERRAQKKGRSRRVRNCGEAVKGLPKKAVARCAVITVLSRCVGAHHAMRKRHYVSAACGGIFFFKRRRFHILLGGGPMCIQNCIPSCIGYCFEDCLARKSVPILSTKAHQSGRSPRFISSVAGFPYPHPPFSPFAMSL